MTPAARVQAAIEILDEILAGAPAERTLTRWARRSRYAGSKDRAALRDLVFDALRCRRSLAALGGAETGRGLMLGACRRDGVDPDTIFQNARHAPAPLTAAERAAGRQPETAAECLDIPDWLWPRLVANLHDRAAPVAQALRSRAPVHLRVNVARCSRDAAIAVLAEDGVHCIPHPAASAALEVVRGSRRVSSSRAYRDGLVELQDAGSQAIAEALPLQDGMRVLDYCAGGGGKTLAMAARARLDLFAHDAAPNRMKNLPQRAERAGVSVKVVDAAEARRHRYDLVLCDVPCSGSGAWRRAPEGKWRLGPDRLQTLLRTQAGILDETAALVAPNGTLAYATCSVLQEENHAQIAAFRQREPGWTLRGEYHWLPDSGTDGFYLALLTRQPDGL